MNKEGELIKVELNQHENQMFNMNYNIHKINHLMMGMGHMMGSAMPINRQMMGMNPMMMNMMNNMGMKNINNNINNNNNYYFTPHIYYNQNYNPFPNMNLNINSLPNIINTLSMNKPQRNINSTHEDEIRKNKNLEKKEGNMRKR